MRRKVIAGNWKMNLDHRQGETLARELLGGLNGRKPSVEIIIIPPFTTLPSVLGVVGGTIIGCGAQDLWYEDKGAFTGEISGPMLKSLGCDYVLVGHSERRHIRGEDSELLSRKLRAALRAGLIPIFCVGELLPEREKGKAETVVVEQLRQVLGGLEKEEISRVIIAYEPVWAIGTGKTATPEDASQMHGVIRNFLEELFGSPVSAAAVILYGGSVKPENASRLLAAADVDGALVGGASLQASSFLGIVFPS
ncbi:MAG: triose-phosphate isomerase [Candidatus Krumholzibacteriota bacterium]|nr:triose-phosphate isomerase [Candidatus Krumholzibacteriota bacterium]